MLRILKFLVLPTWSYLGGGLVVKVRVRFQFSDLSGHIFGANAVDAAGAVGALFCDTQFHFCILCFNIIFKISFYLQKMY